jgi:hypothetical protein
VNSNDRRFAWPLSIAASAGLGIGATLLFQLLKEPSPPPLLRSIEKMGHLVVLKVNYSDLIEFSEDRNLGIPWSEWKVTWRGTRVLLIAKGDCLVATNLRTANYEAVDPVNGRVTLVLSAPTTVQPRLNHAPPAQGGSRLYAMSNKGIEAIIPGDTTRTKAVDAAMALAQWKVEEACNAPDVISAARVSAEGVLKNSFAAIGWDASIKWK